MPTITIRNRRTGAVLYSHKTTYERQASGLAMRDAMEAAVKSSADLSSANLRSADLSFANLRSADLRSANLSSAKVRDLSLTGPRPFLAIGPIGSESRTVFVWLTESGLRIQAGCFFGTRDEFTAQLSITHGDNEHAQEYTAALLLIDAHARLWAPTAEFAQAE